MLPTDEELRDGAGYIFYELSTMFHARTIQSIAAGKLQDGAADENAMWRAMQCCAIESFLVHYRNLRDFLNNFSVGQDGDSLLARHYVITWTGDGAWKADRGERLRLDKLLAHISFQRDTPGPGSWDLEKMEQHVCRVFLAFVNQVPAGHIVFARAMEAYRARTSPAQRPASVVTPSGASTAAISHYDWWKLDAGQTTAPRPEPNRNKTEN
jgi:hypothetical protein